MLEKCGKSRTTVAAIIGDLYTMTTMFKRGADPATGKRLPTSPAEDAATNFFNRMTRAGNAMPAARK